jgi:hypothetical protein
VRFEAVNRVHSEDCYGDVWIMVPSSSVEVYLRFVMFPGTVLHRGFPPSHHVHEGIGYYHFIQQNLRSTGYCLPVVGYVQYELLISSLTL